MISAQKTVLWILSRGFKTNHCVSEICDQWPFDDFTVLLVKNLFRPVLRGVFFHPSSAQMIMTDSVTAQTEFNSTMFPQLSLPAPTADTPTPSPLLPAPTKLGPRPYAQRAPSGLLHHHFDPIGNERPLGSVKSNASGGLSGFGLHSVSVVKRGRKGRPWTNWCCTISNDLQHIWSMDWFFLVWAIISSRLSLGQTCSILQVFIILC